MGLKETKYNGLNSCMLCIPEEHLAFDWSQFEDYINNR